jgi:hypothetical protein
MLKVALILDDLPLLHSAVKKAFFKPFSINNLPLNPLAVFLIPPERKEDYDKHYKNSNFMVIEDIKIVYFF